MTQNHDRRVGNPKVVLIECDKEEQKDAFFVHIASTRDKALEWIREHGQNWEDEPYCFVLSATEVDKTTDFDEPSTGSANVNYADMHGNLLPNHPYAIDQDHLIPRFYPNDRVAMTGSGAVYTVYDVKQSVPFKYQLIDKDRNHIGWFEEDSLEHT